MKRGRDARERGGVKPLYGKKKKKKKKLKEDKGETLACILNVNYRSLS